MFSFTFNFLIMSDLLIINYSYLEKIIKWNPEEKDVSKTLYYVKSTIDNPICQPFCVIVLLFAFYCLYSKYLYR